MKKLIARANISLIALLMAGQLSAQSLEDVRTQMIKDWERSKAYTIEYLEAMPPSDYGFKPVDSIRSFAQQMLHLAQGCGFFMSSATGNPPPSFVVAKLEESPTAQSKDSVISYLNQAYTYAMNSVKNFDLSKWFEDVKVFSFNATPFALMNKAFEHQAHHRGQTTAYIRLKGLRPPQEKLF